jgi:hypothetical protein
MKSLTTFLFLVFLLMIFTSCRNNRLKANEKELAKEILSREKELEKEVQKDSSPGSKNYQSASFKKKEIRSVDIQRPPVRIDLPETKNNIKKFKLSDVASSVTYIKLQTPPDTLLLYDHFFYRPDLMSIIRSDGEQIIFQGIFGLTRFNIKGEYQETIWKNETGIEMRGAGVMWKPMEFVGVMPNNPVSVTNGNIYYSFNDGPAGQGSFMKYKFAKNKPISIQSRTEIPGTGILPGDTLSWTRQKPLERFDLIYGIGNDAWAGINQKLNAGKTGSLLVTFNDNGDTLCKFTDYDRIVNFTHSSFRNSANLESYTYNGLLTIKQEYNDTLFRLIPPDRLLPAYIISFGDNTVKYMDGLNPEFDLSGKYMLNSLFEANDFLLMRYTQNNDSPNNRRKGTVKFYNVLFDKKQGKVYQEPGFFLLPEDFKNDIDGGLPFWPDYITPQGEMMKLVSVKRMNDYISSDAFTKADISIEQRQKLSSMISGLKPVDMIIMIVK